MTDLRIVATEKIKKLVLAYSGGLDTSVMLRWIKDHFGCEVIAYCAEVGQGDETDGLEEKALKTGASKLYIVDLREEFARDFVFPMMRANAVYEGYYLLGTSIARPVIAKKLVEIARKEGADAVAHGATGKGNDQVRFELTFARLAPDLKVIAPWRRTDWPFVGRADMIAYATEKKIPVHVTAEKPYSMDRNLVHVSYEGGILEDPWREPYNDMFRMTVSPEDAPDKPEYVEIEYAGGNPVAINGETTRAREDHRARQRNRGTPRHRPRRSGREPLRRNQIARSLRDSRRDDPLPWASRGRAAHPRSRGDASARLAYPTLRGNGVLRILVCARA